VTGEHRAPDTEPVPTRAEVAAAMAEPRALAEQVVEEEPRWVAEIAQKVAGRTARRYGLIALVVAVIVSLSVSIAALSTAAATDERVEVALARLDEANAALAARGQPPVEPPENTPEAVTAAAVAAQVLASLPPTPTAQEVADRLRGAVIGSLAGPSFDELARLVDAYFVANPPVPGPAPTAEQIRAAVEAELAENPPPSGPPGEPGAPGEPGEQGPPGEQGRSVARQEFVRDSDGDCMSRVTYSDGSVETRPAGDDACPGGGVIGSSLRRR
jgi:hypothetical protein